jgi:hypothetical protein
MLEYILVKLRARIAAQARTQGRLSSTSRQTEASLSTWGRESHSESSEISWRSSKKSLLHLLLNISGVLGSLNTPTFFGGSFLKTKKKKIAFSCLLTSCTFPHFSSPPTVILWMVLTLSLHSNKGKLRGALLYNKVLFIIAEKARMTLSLRLECLRLRLECLRLRLECLRLIVG